MDNGLEVFLLRTLPRSKGVHTLREVRRMAAKATLEVLPWVHTKLNIEGSMSYGCKDPRDSNLVFLSNGSKVDRFDLRTQEKQNFTAESADSKLNIRIWDDFLLLCHYNGPVRIYKDYCKFPNILKIWDSPVTFSSKLVLGEHGDAISSNEFLAKTNYYYLGQDQAVHKVDLKMLSGLVQTTAGVIESTAGIDSIVSEGPVATFTITKTENLIYASTEKNKIFARDAHGKPIEGILTEDPQLVATHMELVGPNHVVVAFYDPKQNVNSLAVVSIKSMRNIQRLGIDPELQSSLQNSEQDEKNHFRNIHIHSVSKQVKLVLCVMRCIGMQTYFFVNQRLILGPYINKFDPASPHQGYIFTIVAIKTERSLEAEGKKPKHKAEWWVLLGSGSTKRFGLQLP